MAGASSWPPLKLNNGNVIPAIGLGMYRVLKEEDVMTAVDQALASGYRLFDTAAIHGNETMLGRAFKELLPVYELKRDDIFVTSKLSSYEMHSKTVVKDAYQKCLDNLGFDYLDLFLIHFPGVPNVNPINRKHKFCCNTAWSALLELYDAGMVNAIGVSNFTVDLIKELLQKKYDVVPAVNQVEWHPLYRDQEVYKLCHANDIVIQGYSPFAGANDDKGCLLSHPTVLDIAADLGVTPAQVLLVWSLQNDVAVISKSINRQTIHENIQLDFRLSHDHIKSLDHLSSNKKSCKRSSPTYLKPSPSELGRPQSYRNKKF